MSALGARRELNLLSTVAHELRGPLTALATSSGLLVENFDGFDQQQLRAMVSAIHRRALWLHGLAENLLCAATIRDGRLRIAPRRVRLADVIAEIQPVVVPLLSQSDQRLRVSVGSCLPDVLADPGRIGQVFVNLITNASKFSGRRTPIDVSVKHRGMHVRVTVADRGPGIPDGSRNLLFEPFYRAAPAERSHGDGVGLGLAIVKSIVEAHGGRVGVARRRGRGARFWFELPALPSAADGVKPTRARGGDADEGPDR